MEEEAGTLEDAGAAFFLESKGSALQPKHRYNRRFKKELQRIVEPGLTTPG